MSLTLCLASMAPPGCMGRRKARTRRRSANWRREWRIIASCLRKPSDSTSADGPAPGPRAVWGLRLSPIPAGIDLVLELLNADDHLRDAALTIVGEGWLDRQSAFGKAPVGVAGKAARHGVPVVALCGGRDESSRQLYQHHIDAMWSICQRPMALAESMNTCEPLLADAAENVLRTFLSGWRGEAHKRITVLLLQQRWLMKLSPGQWR